MSVHQIIYTSCMRGINGVNDGQQVYSYDASFKDAGNDEIKGLFTYQTPALEAGVLMSEEIALTMPQAFIFRRLENGACALVLNTYLGRDYMGSTGRFGNHLSHVVTFDPEDTACYPAEYYGGGTLRSRMEYSEVNNPDRPDYLPAPRLERGRAVNIDAVIGFLSVGGRLEIYKNMLHAMLSCESKKKRVVICDKPENTILWIAALTFALPLKNALHINFSTYVFDPALSSSRICGVVPSGTRYNADSRRLHFTFDLLEGQSPVFDKDRDFYDFIDTALSFSYESLRDFHGFLCSGYQYEGADERIYPAYALYSMLSDGIGGITWEKLDQALRFADDFAVPAETVRIIRRLLDEDQALLRGNKDIFLRVMQYIAGHTGQLDEAMLRRFKELLVDKILSEFLDDHVSEGAFAELYQQINDICARGGFSAATELMQGAHREKLFGVMSQNIAAWKTAFLIRVISDHVKDQKLPASRFYIDTPLGQLYGGIVRAVYEQGRQNGFFAVSKILEAFSDDGTYLTNIGLTLEGILLDLPDGQREAASMWEYFRQIMRTSQAGRFDAAYAAFAGYRRYDQMLALCSLELSCAADQKTCSAIFEKHYRSFVLEYFDAGYCGNVLEAYYRSLLRYDGEDAYSAKAEVLQLLLSQGVNADFADELMRDLIRPIPLDRPSDSNARLIWKMVRYTHQLRRKPISGRLLLLAIGMKFEEVNGNGEMHGALDQLAALTRENKADLSRDPGKNVQDYFDWLLPPVGSFCSRSAEIEAVYSLFRMPASVESMFFERCARMYLKRSRTEKDYTVFCEFLRAFFAHSTARSREEVGKVLRRLKKQKLEELDLVVTGYFRMDEQALRCWDDIYYTAEPPDSLLGKLNPFKRR